MRLARFAFMLSAILSAMPTGFSQTPASTAPRHNVDCVSGKPAAPIKIEVFSDFQCPGCRDLYLNTMRSVFSDYAEAG